MNPKSTSQAAEELGVTRKTLVVWLHRHPEYKPQQRFGGTDYVWTDDEVKRVREARERNKPKN